MARHFTATVLLDRPWEPDPAALADAIRARFPQIGRIEPGRAGAAGEATLDIEGAPVTLTAVPEPLQRERLVPPMKLIRNWQPGAAVRGHAAHIQIACGGTLPGLDGAEAYAAAVHFVAATVCATAPARAVFWAGAWTLNEPRAFADGARMILDGRMPLGAWIGFAAIVPRGYAPSDATGMVSYGMRPFIGRELELAPRPGDPQGAWRCITRVARAILDRGLPLRDGQRIADAGGSFALTVREQSAWLRHDLPAYVLVGEDSIVDPTTLTHRARPVA